MHITAFTLRHLRNIAALDAAPAPGLNLIWGENGQGKTNVLEGIHLALTGRSFRTRTDAQLLPAAAGERAAPRDAAAAAVDPSLAQARLVRRRGERLLRVTLAAEGTKRAFADGQLLPTLAALLGEAAVVVFTPESAALLKEAPGVRRRWLDWTLAQLSPAYLHALQAYTRAVRQLNAALRARAPQREARSAAAAYFPILAANGAALMALRARQLAAAAAALAARWSELGGAGALQLAYAPSLRGDFENVQNMEGALRGALEQGCDKMLARGVCTIGPHRDDFTLALDGHALQAFGSQGQHRLAALALQLESAAWLHAAAGEPPIVLLDDFGSELDAQRRERVLRGLAAHGMQVFISATHPRDLGADELFAWRLRMQAGRGELAKE